MEDIKQKQALQTSNKPHKNKGSMEDLKQKQAHQTSNKNTHKSTQ